MPATPFDQRDGWIWYDGTLVPWREAQLHVLSHALHYASSVFEGERAYGGVIFKSTEHSERLRRSAEILQSGFVERNWAEFTKDLKPSYMARFLAENRMQFLALPVPAGNILTSHQDFSGFRVEFHLATGERGAGGACGAHRGATRRALVHPLLLVAAP